MKYLEQKDQSMHARAKEVIRDCAKKNKEGNPAYSSLSTSMQSHLKNLVGEIYWKKAEDYLRQYLHTQYVKKGVPHEEAKRKANATAQSAASPLALDGVTVPPSVPVGHQSRRHHVQPINSGHTIPPRRTSASQPTPSTDLKSSTNTAAAAAAAQQQASYNAKIQQQREQEQARRTQEMKVAAQKAAAAKKNSAAKNNPTVTNPINTVGSGAKTTSGKSGKGVRPGAGVGGSTPVGSPPITKSKKTSKSKKATPAANAAAAREAAALSVPKEYSDAMEMLDHVVDYDVSSCALILGKDSKKKGESSIISEEQRKLLYHDFGITKIGPRKGLYSGSGRKQSESPMSVTSQTVGGTSSVPSFLKGWGDRNIVSSRVAWAKLRLEEDDEQTIGGLSLPGPKDITATNSDAVSSPSLSQNADVSDSTWFNDETAEDDETLALISEATQHYIKTVLEGAMNSASKRLNLDGIRLWHQQHAVASMREAQVSDKARDPPLHLRLGCDTRRQYSLLQGNAAKTYQRLEEALNRQDPREMNLESIYNATSMTELSKIPKISSAATKADYNAKRTYEIYGGKESGEPPVGRVPKKAKIMAKDFRVCLEESSFAVSRKRVTTSAFF